MKTKQDWLALALVVLGTVTIYLAVALPLTFAWYIANFVFG